MTPPRHGAGAGQDEPHDPRAYEDPSAFEAAVHRLADPLNDPLPGPEPVVPQQQAPYESQAPQQAPQEWYDPDGYQRDWYGHQAPVQPPLTASQPVPDPYVLPDPGPDAVPQPTAEEAMEPATEILGRIDAGDPVVPEPREATEADEPEGVPDAATPTPTPPPTGGRAERRRAAKGHGRRRPAPRPAPGSTAPAKPMTRMEARRAAKAAKDSPAIVISRGIGEIFITLGVLMLLFVTYQLWWTNVRADQIAGRETHKIQDDWAKNENTPEKQEAFEPGQGFAIIHIPKLDVVTPIAEGTSKEKVLDRGMVGHYSEKPLKTAMPSAKEGNFALAGHRNTHGEPFRYINRLKPGDPIVVETREAYYTYEMTSVLAQTSPSNVSVIAPVPKQSGFTKPGRYITLTTCTPEFTSTYRLIVWGKMVDERPRSEGKPDVLAD
ncbi:class E sortase [Streptomyces sp. CB02460]|uniref:class E sortase n=1 Tax=Streptomyces sp. CB02460 TaxID=1703941 RepID=UPI00093D8E80|nr:class E sortase [Streptomyces sp. CB02460]OKJ74056.1 peptidase C60 family protein [Streptomyces sp. CB02460]